MSARGSFLWAAAVLSGGLLGARPLVIGHRGAAADAPENTVAALRLGYAQGADAVECDVRLTGDGRAVLLHDASTRRTTGVDLAVALRTLDKLRALDAGGWKGARWRGEKIPTLDEAMAIVPADRGLVMEIKCGAEILPELERVIAAASAAVSVERLLVIAFDHEVLSAVKRHLPAVKVWWLVGWAKEPATGEWPRVEALADLTKARGFDGLNLSHRFPLDAAAVEAVHARGLKLGVWTVNEADAARRLAAVGVDAITTDRPGWLRARLEGK
jgi:glycerophosphoryl diester phosphodiesterase